jgi:hypothetical protein
MMRGLKLTASAAFLGLAAAAAQASSLAAWAELYAKADTACTKASGLADAKARRETADFQGALLVIIDGRHPNGTRGTAYCLYDKVTGKAETAAGQITQAAAGPKPASKPAQPTGRTCWNGSFGAQLKTPRPIGAACTAKNDEGDSYTGVVQK